MLLFGEPICLGGVHLVCFLSIVIGLYKDKVFDNRYKNICDTPIDSVNIYISGGCSQITMKWITQIWMFSQQSMYQFTNFSGSLVTSSIGLYNCGWFYKKMVNFHTPDDGSLKKCSCLHTSRWFTSKFVSRLTCLFGVHL